MIKLTKEWLLTTIAELEEKRDATPGVVNEGVARALSAMKLALSSLEAEAVAYVDPFAFHNFSVYRAGETDNKRMGREWMWANPDAGLIPVFTAPPVPVSVTDNLAGKSFNYIANKFQVSVSEAQWILVGWNACRAAMLQGANGNSPVIPDGWVACSDRMPPPKTGVIVGCWFGRNWATKWATYLPYHPDAHQSGFLMPGGSWTPTHWMPLPAAPQQEVNP